jgi:threonyl-tRNA synthetase
MADIHHYSLTSTCLKDSIFRMWAKTDSVISRTWSPRTVVRSKVLRNLVEHYAGAFPLWLAPEQVRLIPITEKQHEFCLAAAKTLRANGFRVECDIRSESMGSKIKDARNMRVPYMAVVGEREMESSSFAVRSRREDQLGQMDIETFMQKLRSDLENKV